MIASNLCCCCLLKTSDKDLKTPCNRFGKTEIFSEMLEDCFQIHLIQDNDEEYGICSVCVGRLRDASDFKLQVQRSQAELRARLERPINVRDLNQLLPKMADDQTSGETRLHGSVAVKTEMDDETTDGVLYGPGGSEVKSEEVEGNETTDMLYEPSGSEVKLETLEDDGRTDMLLLFDQDYISNLNQNHTTTDLEAPSTPIKSEKSDDAPSDEDFPSFSGAGAPSLRTYSRRPQRAPTCSVRREPLRGEKATHACRIWPDTCQIWPNKCDLEPSLVTHEMKHEDIFEIRAENTSHLTRHKLNTLKNDEYNKETRRKKLKRIHNDDNKYICDICDKSFERKCYLARHMNIHTGNKLFSCEVCNKTFTRKDKLSAHKMTRTCLKPFYCQAKYVCDICDKQFKKRNCLVAHMRIHMTIIKVARKTNLSEHKITRTGLEARRREEKCICDICNKQFKRKIYLAQHMRIHRERKLFSCEVCNKKFTRKPNLKSHIITHTGLKPFCCEICDKRFTLKSNLTKHIQLHTGHKPFTCDICGAQFSRKYSLMVHITIHTRQKPYVCEICNRKFSYMSNLYRHKRRTHTGPKLFSYECEECNKRFTRKANLNKHKQLHT